MSINIKNLTVKNFMSVGNATQAIDFTQKDLTLVLGENLDQGGAGAGARNGTGKSTIVNALSYAIFGQALTSIKKDNLINKINNKNMLVTVDFIKDGTEYRIERGRKPTILKYFINKKEQEVKPDDDSQGDSRETQKDINKLFGMSHDMFKHIAALNTYTVPFLSMKSGEQREIIEQLLGITVLSEKAETLRNQIKVTKEEIFRETTKLETIKQSNERIIDSINSLRLKQAAWSTKKEKDSQQLVAAIAELATLDINAELLSHEIVKKYKENSDKLSALSKQKISLSASIKQSKLTIDKCKADALQLEQNTCPACNQELHNHMHASMQEKIQSQYESALEFFNSASQSVNDIDIEIQKIGNLPEKPTTFYTKIDDVYNHRSNLETLETQLTLKLQEVDTYQEQIDQLEATAIQEINWDSVNQLSALKDHQEFLLKLLTNKDSFIRKKIIDQNLLYLNARLTYYLDKVGLPHEVEFQNDLSVAITQLGQELDFDNLSRGERNRLILGLSWAFRDVWENLYQSINLLFIDELVDSGMDSNGVDNSLSVLKKMVRERQKTVFLISHKEELINRVNNILRVVKESGFTTYSTDIDINA